MPRGSTDQRTQKICEQRSNGQIQSEAETPLDTPFWLLPSPILIGL